MQQQVNVHVAGLPSHLQQDAIIVVFVVICFARKIFNKRFFFHFFFFFFLKLNLLLTSKVKKYFPSKKIRPKK